MIGEIASKLPYIGIKFDPPKIPIQSMYCKFAYIYPKNQPNVGVYTIHGMG